MMEGKSHVKVDLDSFRLLCQGTGLEGVTSLPRARPRFGSRLGSRQREEGNPQVVRLLEDTEYNVRVSVETDLKTKFRKAVKINGLNNCDFGNFKVSWEENLDNVQERLRDKTATIEVAIAKKATGRFRKAVRGLLTYVTIGKVTINLHTIACGSVRQNVRLTYNAATDTELRLEFNATIRERAIAAYSFGPSYVHLESEFEARWRFDHSAVGIRVPSRQSRSREPRKLELDDSTCGERPLMVPDAKRQIFRAECTLEEMIKGSLHVMVRSVDGQVCADGYITMFRYLQATRGREALVEVPLVTASTRQPCGTFTTSLIVANGPSVCQLRGGVRTEGGIHGGRPLVFGVPLPRPDTDSKYLGSLPFEDAQNVEGNWAQVIDTFLYISYYNSSRDRWSWFPEDDPRFGSQEFDEPFLHRFGSADNWLHPEARRLTVQGQVEGTTPEPAAEVTDNGPPSRPGGDSGSDPDIPHCAPIGEERPVASNSDAETDAEAAAAMLSRQVLESPGSPSAEANDVDAPAETMRTLDTPEPPPEPAAPVAPLKRDGRPHTFRWRTLEKIVPDKPRGGPPVEGATITPMFDGTALYKFGGRGRYARSNEIFAFDNDELSWARIPTRGPTPTARTGHCAASMGHGTRMLVFGGSASVGRLNDTYIYEADNNRWMPVTASASHAPNPRARMAMGALDDGSKAYLFGGREGYIFLGDRYYNDLFLFDGARGEWFPQAVTSGPVPNARCGHSMNVINNRLLMVFGGLMDSISYYNDTWLYDTLSGRWTKPPYAQMYAPSPREAHSTVLVEDHVVLYAGQADSGAYLNDVHLFDVNRLQWCVKPELTGASPGARCGAAMAPVSSSTLMVFGGDVGFNYENDTHLLELTTVVSPAKLLKMPLKWSSEDDLCVVCLDNRVSVAFLWCGHCCCCSSCTERLIHCPVCRRKVTRYETIDSKEDVLNGLSVSKLMA